MVKKVMWIDDYEKDMKNIIKAVFPLLWNNGIVSEIFYLGDGASESSVFNSKRTEELILDMFYQWKETYENVTGAKAKIPKKNFEIITEAFESEKSCFVREIPFNNNNTLWDSLCSATLPLDETTQDKLIAPLFTKEYIENADDYVYVIDVKLMLQDVEKIDCEQSNCKPILSMELYNYIKKKLKRDCIIYSRYTYLNRVNDNWNYVYKNSYNSNDETKIFNRVGFTYGSIDSNYINKIVEICNKE